MILCSLMVSAAPLASNSGDGTPLLHPLSLPMGFERYDADSNIDFVARAAGYSVYFSPGEIMLDFVPAEKVQGSVELVRVNFVGANKQARPEADEALPGVIHYYLGNDPSRWRTNVQRFRKVRYRDVYPGIGLVFYSKNQYSNDQYSASQFLGVPFGSRQELEFDFEVAPGAEVSAISMRFEGATAREFDGNVELVTPSGNVAVLKKPQIYQLRQGKRELVSGGYVVRAANEIGFAVVAYDKSLPLIIDPALAYSTLVQRLLELTLFSGQFPPGTESFEFDGISGMTADSSGAYLTGFALVPDPSLGFTTGSPPQAISKLSVEDAFVVKLDPTGSSLVYTAYLGGNASQLAGSGGNKIAVDANGNAYIVGSTTSPSFVTTPGVFNTVPACATETISNKNCSQLFAAKLDATGHLVFSTFLTKGGSTDKAGPSLGGQRIAVDSSGAVYVAGNVFPAQVIFPKDQTPPSVAGLTTTAGAFQTTRKNDKSDYVLKLHPDGSVLDYSTYLGGSTEESIGGVAVDSSGVAYVAGTTSSSDFPTTNGAFQTTNSTTSAFFTKLKTDGSGLLYSTFLGASTLLSGASGIAIDGTTNAFLTGSTNGNGFPTTTGAFKTSVPGAGNFNFVSEFDTTGKLAFSTYIGDGVVPGNIAADGTGVYVAGITFSPTYPLLNSIEPPFFGTPMYVTKLNLTGTALVYSTFVGSPVIRLSDMALDLNQNVYLAGTPDLLFPTTLGSFQPLPQIRDITEGAGFVTKITPSLGAPVAVVQPRILIFPGILQQGVSSALTVLLSNFGDASMSFTSVAITGANASDFSQTNNCGSTVAGGANCKATVVFTPTVGSGVRVANLVFTFGGGLPSQTVSLTGTAGTPAFQITPTPGDFGTLGQLENNIQNFTITNTGTGPLALSSFTFSKGTDFSFGFGALPPPAQVLQPGQTSMFSIVLHIGLNFGNLTDQFTVQDNAPSNPHVFQLTGFGFVTKPDFGLSTPNGVPATATITAGQTATYNVIVASLPGLGLGGGSISVSCGGAPAGANCTPSRGSLPLPDNNPEAVVVSVSTTGATASLKMPGQQAWSLWPVFAVAGMVCIWPRKRRGASFILMASVLAIAATLAGCGGGGGSKGPPPIPTAPGTYTLTVTASSGNATHSLPMTLIVK
ncbi:MAG TPA: SBBP repeat-containing protein [Candidatus Angelobacter sp.]|nr:SBBP repeat-containing protein [Candidatus Angelobacter sp.]